MKSVNKITVIFEINCIDLLNIRVFFITECERQSGTRPSERSPVDNIGVSQASIRDKRRKHKFIIYLVKDRPPNEDCIHIIYVFP